MVKRSVVQSNDKVDSIRGIDHDYRERFEFMFNSNNKYLRAFAYGLMFSEFYRTLYGKKTKSLFNIINPMLFYKGVFGYDPKTGMGASWYKRAEANLSTIKNKRFADLVSTIQADLFTRAAGITEIEYELTLNDTNGGAVPSIGFKLRPNLFDVESDNYPMYLKHSGKYDTKRRLYAHVKNGFYVLTQNNTTSKFYNLAETAIADNNIHISNIPALNAITALMKIINTSNVELDESTFMEQYQDKLNLKPC